MSKVDIPLDFNHLPNDNNNTIFNIIELVNILKYKKDTATGTDLISQSMIENLLLTVKKYIN